LNFLAFYLGVVFFERSGIISGVVVFLLIAMAGTVMASGLERLLSTMGGRVLCRCADRVASQSAERLYSGRNVRS
jgi:hypothetical protein